MSELHLQAGRTYRAKRPAQTGSIFQPLVNDRTILWLGAFEVQYDGPGVALGRRFPRITKEAFLKWADRDVTDELPKGEYQQWPIPKAEKERV